MTTDFSQAIVNGFGIAAKWREMGQQEERMRLDESYRRDAMSENRRQFDLGLKETTTARNQRDARVGETIGLQRNDLAARKINQEATIRQGDERLGLAKRAMDDEIGRKNREEEDAYLGQIAEYQLSQERAGKPLSEQQILQMYTGNPIGQRLMERAGLPVKSVRDGTVFNTAVQGPDGSTTVAGRRADGSMAIPDQARTADNRTPPFTIAPGNVMTMHTAAVMSSPTGIAAARRHAALTNGKAEADQTEADIQQALVDLSAQAQAKYQAAKEAEAKAQPAGVPVTNEGIDLGGSRAQRAWRVVSGIPAALGNLPSNLVNSGWNPNSGEIAAGEVPSLAQPLARPPLQPPAPITELPADHPLMQRRASLLQQQENLRVFDQATQMGLSADQAGAWMATQQPSESVAGKLLDADRRMAEGLAAETAAGIKARDEGYKALGAEIDRLTEGNDFLKERRGEMYSILSNVNASTGGAMGADAGLRSRVSDKLVSLISMGDDLPGLDPRYKNDILGAMALKAANPSNGSVLDISNPEQVAKVAKKLNTLYRGVPEGISPKQQALLADLAASDKSSEEMAAIKDAYLNADPATVDKWYSATFR